MRALIVIGGAAYFADISPGPTEEHIARLLAGAMTRVPVIDRAEVRGEKTWWIDRRGGGGVEVWDVALGSVIG